jgi:hypothetical protein
MREGTPSGLRQMSTGVPSRGTACPLRERWWRRRPCCRGGRPSCHRPRACAWLAMKTLDLLDDAGSTSSPALDRVELALALHLEHPGTSTGSSPMMSMILLRIGDGSISMCRSDGSQLAEQRLGDLAVGRDDDLAGLAVDHVERDLLAEQDVGEAPRSAARAACPFASYNLPRSA